MKIFTITIIFVLFDASTVSGQQSCFNGPGLIELDAQWEKALLESDADFLQAITAEEFIWVHNHAGTIDSKSDLIERASDPNRRATGATRARTQSGVEARILGTTGVVTGFTLVDRGPTPTRYSFMRTYVEKEGRCVLFANQTMASPEED